jgi:hypothetical protein
MIFTVFFTNNAVPKTGLSPVIDIWELDGTHVVNAQAMVEIAGGFYKYDFSVYDASVDYVVRADSVILTGPERYSYSSNEHKTELDRILGLSHENIRIYDQDYSSEGNLLSCKVRIFSNADDCNNNIDQIGTYTMTSAYDSSKRLNLFKMIASV